MGGAGSWELAARGVSKAVGGRALRLPIVRNALGQIDSWALFKHSELSTPQWPLENAGVCVCVCAVTSDSLRPRRLYSPPGSSVHGILQARILE